MPIPISYMGTKKMLAPAIAQVVSKSRPGPIFDIFSGLCAVAKCVATSRQIWTNDFQYFSYAVARAHFCSYSSPPRRSDMILSISRHYSRHMNVHGKIASQRISSENDAISEENAEKLNEIYADWENQGSLVSSNKNSSDATLFRDTFAGTFFGLLQCIEIDGLRAAIDIMLCQKQINQEEHRWLLLALAVAISRCSNSTGHFAQPLRAKPANIHRFALQRKRSVKDCFLSALDMLKAVGNSRWRSRNKAFRGDANIAVANCTVQDAYRPAVIYADPPYTADQYSRYYHVYETLIRYDYPSAHGNGRYRPDREVSDFCLTSQILKAFDTLISSCAEAGSDLVLSYPENGLLNQSRDILPEIIKKYYGREAEIYMLNHKHSTLGASKGHEKKSVTEIIYRGYIQ